MTTARLSAVHPLVLPNIVGDAAAKGASRWRWAWSPW